MGAVKRGIKRVVDKSDSVLLTVPDARLVRTFLSAQ